MTEKKKSKFIGLDFKKKGDRRKVLFGSIFFILLLIFLFFFSGSYGILELVRLKRENSKLLLRKESLLKDRAAVQDSIKKAEGDTAFLEKLAREKIGMTKKGEKVFHFVPSSEKE